MAETGKAGAVLSVVFGLIMLFVLFLMLEFNASGSYFLFVFSIILIVIFWSTRRTRTKLQQDIDELASESKAGREQLRRRIADLESQLRMQGGPVSGETAPVEPAPSASADHALTPGRVSSPPEPLSIGPAHASVPPPPPPPFRSGPARPPLEPTGATVHTPSPGRSQRVRQLLNFEELLGTNWLAKIGAAILVLGIAFFLAWQLREVGPAGKVLVGWLTGAVMLGAGIFFERHERYRIVARAGVAAGWALLFCTGYAMNHIAAARVLDSATLDLLVMFIVATAMVLHTLRYRSQVVTGLAFLLAFGAIAVNRVPDVYSLTAAVVLAGGVVIVALRMRWFTMELCAIAVTFLNHWLWLRPIIEPMGKHHHSFPEFLPSAVILISYWAIFRVSYLLRERGEHERLSAYGALLNTGLLLLVLKYQSVHPEMAFWALLVLGAVELALGQLRNARTRSLPHIVLTVIGVCLLLTAIPFRFGPEYVSLIWVAEAEAFFLTGVFARETVFRRVGMFSFVPLTGQLFAFEIARIYGARMDGADVKGEFAPALICAFCALVIYVNSHWIALRRPSEFEHTIERLTTRDLSYAASALMLAAGWMAFYFSGTAVCWMALACIIAWVSHKLEARPLRTQSMLLAVFAFVRVLAVNLPMAGSAHILGLRWSARLVTTAAVVVICYLTAFWHRRRQAESSWLDKLEYGISWLASSMLTLLMWYELNTAAVALAWGAFALIMLETGVARRSLNLRVQAYAAGISVFLRILFVNLNATSALPSRLGPRLYSIVPLLILFFYFYSRLEADDDLAPFENRFKPAQLFAWMGTLAAVLLLRFELPLDWVATGWAIVVFALVLTAWRLQKRVFLHQAMLVSAGVISRGVFHNLYERSYFISPSHFHSAVTVFSAAGVLFAALPFAFKLKSEPAGEGGRLVRIFRMLDAHPEQWLFFLPLALITVFLAVELQSGMITVAWGLEAVAVFLAALWVGERSYRLSALGLLFLCVGKIIAIDIWRLGIRDRAITFIVLGTLILGVSILYSRNREKVRAFL